MSDQLVAKVATYTLHERPCRQRDSYQRSQQWSSLRHRPHGYRDRGM